MDKLDRVFEMHRVLSARRRPVPKADLAEALGGCSHKTLLRQAQPGSLDDDLALFRAVTFA